MVTQQFVVNRNIKKLICSMDKKPTAVADRAGLRRDIFSRIINCKRPVYADEVIPIALAMGVSIEALFEKVESVWDGESCEEECEVIDNGQSGVNYLCGNQGSGDDD